ncbi:MAG: hypothetical protein ACFB9N_07230 [Geitlerinemataceae cyanobacterium]
MVFAQRLEQYTLKRPEEVLLIDAEIDGEEDCVTIFRGFSSSLMRSTAFDPDVPVLPESATIVRADRLCSPYNPDDPQYIERDLDRDRLEDLCDSVGV